MMQEPLVSIIMCIRNGERFVGEALDSIAVQVVQNSEVIVVDDGSTDSSARIVERHPLAPELLRQEALGFSAALNRGVHAASGRFVAFIDSDDVWPADRMAHLLTAIDHHPEVEAVYGALINTDSDLRPKQQPIAARMLTTSLFRRDAAARVGDLRTDVVHAANVDWISRASTAGLAFLAIDAVVLYRRIHDRNMSVVDRDRGKQDMLRVIRDHHARRIK